VDEARELEDAFVDRDPRALDCVYSRYFALLCAVARSTLGGESDAEDCVHDTVLRVWISKESYRLERGALRAYLIVCVRNEALARKRKAARRRTIDVRVMRLTVDDSADFAAVDHIELQRLREALRELPDAQRTVVELAYFGDRSQSEISSELGLPLGTVKSRVAAGLQKLAVAFAVKAAG
jgi:RNA polymerase sigma-70 factor (ECF subfamily)